MNKKLISRLKPDQIDNVLLKAYIHQANRYIKNGKETLSKSAIEGTNYVDEKYTREAAGILYLAALKAIDGYLLSKMNYHVKMLPKSIEGYQLAAKKMPQNGKLTKALSNVYENLHLLAYYRDATSTGLFKDGITGVKQIINMLKD